MNACDFVHNLDSDSISNMVSNFFDELMVLYHLVGDRQDIEICTDNDASVATFMILMETKRDAKRLYDTLNGSDFSVYNMSYRINMNLKDSTVETVIVRASS